MKMLPISFKWKHPFSNGCHKGVVEKKKKLLKEKDHYQYLACRLALRNAKLTYLMIFQPSMPTPDGVIRSKGATTSKCATLC